MGISDEHYFTVRKHFLSLFGGECVFCGSVFNLELHHKNQDKNLLTGKNRGREKRMWDWFFSYEENNLTVLCHDCHKKHHKLEQMDD